MPVCARAVVQTIYKATRRACSPELRNFRAECFEQLITYGEEYTAARYSNTARTYIINDRVRLDYFGKRMSERRSETFVLSSS